MSAMGSSQWPRMMRVTGKRAVAGKTRVLWHTVSVTASGGTDACKLLGR